MNLYKRLTKNWKTTLAGVIILVSLVLMSFGIITGDQFTAILGAVTAAGLFASKDSERGDHG